MNKKAEGLPINLLIIAIIALVVLVVIVSIFTTGIGDVVKKIFGIGEVSQTCNEQGGELKEKTDKGCGTDYTKVISSDSEGKNMLCCKKK